MMSDARPASASDPASEPLDSDITQKNCLFTQWVLFVVLLLAPSVASAHVLVKGYWFSGWVDLILWLPFAGALGLAALQWRQLWARRPQQPRLALLLSLGLLWLLWIFFNGAWQGTIVWQTAVAEGVRWSTMALFALVTVALLPWRWWLLALCAGLGLLVWLNLILPGLGVENYFSRDETLGPTRPSRFARALGLDLRQLALPLASSPFNLAVPLGVIAGIGASLLLWWPGWSLMSRGARRRALWLVVIGLVFIGAFIGIFLTDRKAPTGLLPVVVLATLLLWRWGPPAALAAGVTALPVAIPALFVACPWLLPSWQWSSRRVIWEQWMGLMAEQPQLFILGAGLHGYRPLRQEYFPEQRLLDPHNVPLQAIVEGGWLWLLMLCALVWWLLRGMIQCARSGSDGERLLAVAGIAAVLGIWWNGITSPVLGPNYQVPTMLLMFFAAWLLLRRREQPGAITNPVA